MQRLQKLGCQLVKGCCEEVDEQGGIVVAATEAALDGLGNRTFRELAAEGHEPRAVAVEVALRSWKIRRTESMTMLTYIARAAHSASLQKPALTVGRPVAGISKCTGIAVMVVRQELAVSAALGCANPRCKGMAAVVSSEAAARWLGKLKLCGSCRGVRYCR